MGMFLMPLRARTAHVISLRPIPALTAWPPRLPKLSHERSSFNENRDQRRIENRLSIAHLNSPIDLYVRERRIRIRDDTSLVVINEAPSLWWRRYRNHVRDVSAGDSGFRTVIPMKVHLDSYAVYMRWLLAPSRFPMTFGSILRTRLSRAACFRETVSCCSIRNTRIILTG